MTQRGPKGGLGASIELENRNEHFLNAALESLTIEDLAVHLASHEIKRVYGELPKDSPEEYARWSRLYEAAHEPILAELQKNGFKNVRLEIPII